MPNNTNDEPTVVDMSLRGLMKKLILVAKNPTTFNMYSTTTVGQAKKGKLLFSFIHAKEALVNDYEYLDNDILEKEVIGYSIVTQYNIDVILNFKYNANSTQPNASDTDPAVNPEEYPQESTDNTTNTNNGTQPITNTNP